MKRRSRSRSKPRDDIKRSRSRSKPRDDIKRSRSRSQLPKDFVKSLLMPVPSSIKKGTNLSAVQKAGIHPLFHTRVLLDIGDYYTNFPFVNEDIKVEYTRIIKDVDVIGIVVLPNNDIIVSIRPTVFGAFNLSKK